MSGRSGCPEPGATRPQSHTGALLTHEPLTLSDLHTGPGNEVWQEGIVRQGRVAAEDPCAQLARAPVQSPALANSTARHKLFGLSLGFLICKMGTIRALTSQRHHED